MKKVLYVTTVSGTINGFLVPHIERLIEDGYKVDCACSITEPIDKELINKEVKVFEIPFSRNPLDIGNLKAFKMLLKIQKKNRYDIIHVHTPIAALYGRLLKLKFPNIKNIYTAHGFHFYKGAPKKNWMIYYPIEKIMSKFTDTIVTINNEDYKQALKFKIKNTYQINGVGLDLSKYNLNLFNKNEMRKELGLSNSDFIIVMIAEINKNKNHIQMVKAVEILKNKGIEVKVLCAGKGPLQEYIEEEIKNKNLNSNIHMLGYRNDIPKLIAACDIGMLLSYREGLPRNIMELMAFRKPVIATNIRGVRDLIRDKYNGLLIDVEDVESTAKSIELLYKDRDFMEYIGKNAYESIKKYDIEEVLKDLINIY